MKRVLTRSAKRSVIGPVSVVAVMLITVFVAGPAQAAVPSGPDHGVQVHSTHVRQSSTPAPNVVCGYNDNVNGRAGWQNCDATNDFIRTTALLGSVSYQCVPGWQWWDLGPTWFIHTSELVDFC